jgi:hypothetical protein
MIDVHCGECGLHVQIEDMFAGKKGKCPQCGAVLVMGSPLAAGPGPAAEKQKKRVTAESSPPQTDTPSASPPAATAATAAAPPAGEAEPIPFDSLGDEEPSAHVLVPDKSRLGDDAASSDILASESGLARTTAPAAGIHHGDGTDAHVPKHLDLMSHYLVCNHKDIIARWQSDGRGWLVRVKDGFARASTVANHIPQFGKFVLIEVGVERRDDGIHLRAVTAFRLQEHYALTKLVHGDDQILSVVNGVTEPNPQQRSHIRALVHQKFLPHIWPELDELLPEIEGE